MPTNAKPHSLPATIQDNTFSTLNMISNRFFILFIIVIVLTAGLIGLTVVKNPIEDNFITYEIDPNSQRVEFYWKDEQGKTIRNIQSLKAFIESKNSELIFAMNGGMFKPDNSPQGLFIQQFKTLTPLDTSSGTGNFYLKPNGIFYITTDNIPIICKTIDFVNNGEIKCATQSGPLLISDGQIHPAFRDSSQNLNIRNGVGVLPGNKIIFVMSKVKINFYEFATYFKSLGCKNALYLDGFVSRMYLPEKNWTQLDGDFGVIIGASKSKDK